MTTISVAGKAAYYRDRIGCLLATAQGMVNEREAKAEMFAADYRLASWDEAGQVAVVKSPQGAEYSVSLSEGCCTCPDFADRCQPMNERLIAAGFGGGIECKHGGIARRLVAARKAEKPRVISPAISAKTFSQDWN